MSDSFAPPKLTVTTSLPRDPRLHVRDHATFLRETLGEAAAEHHRRHVPRHFQPFAAAKYGYARRRLKYQRLKDRFGLPPLVSPLSRTQGRPPTNLAVMTDFAITKTQKRSTLKMRLPFRGGTGRLRLTGNGLSKPQKILLRTIAEIEFIAPDEQRALNEWIHRRYAQRVNEPGVKFKVRN